MEERRVRVLHAGCGGARLPAWFGETDEVRLDIDESVHPDVVASLSDMGEIGPFDLIYSSHCLEHLFPHEVGGALGEFLRVLRPGGVAVVFVPDLEGVDPTTEVLFEADAGPITGRDLIYGYAPQVEKSPYMAHHTGFVESTLKEALEKAGFSGVMVKRIEVHNLMAVGVKQENHHVRSSDPPQ